MCDHGRTYSRCVYTYSVRGFGSHVVKRQHAPVTNPNVEQDTSLDGSGLDSGEKVARKGQMSVRDFTDAAVKRQVPPQLTTDG